MQREHSSHVSCLCLLIACVLAGTGCGEQAGGQDRIAATAGESASTLPNWPYWPVRMRIHPLTRVMDSNEAGGRSTALIEARIEFFDRDQHTSKAVGRIRLDLVSSASTQTVASAAPEGLTWEQNLADLSTNRQKFDDVTQTYSFRLGIPLELLKGDSSLDLRAYFLGEDGARLDAQMRIK